VEKALAELTDLGNPGAINHPLMIRSIENKLPDQVKREWVIFKAKPENGVTPVNHFNALLKFLKEQEEILESLEQLKITETSEKMEKPQNRFERKYA